MSFETITSVHNPRVKAAARLRDARQRTRQARFIIDGVREIERAVEAGVKLAEVFVCHDFLASPEARALADALRATPAELVPVAPKVFEKLAYGDRTEGLLAVAIAPRRALNELQLPENPLVCVLEGVEKPGNFGAVVRSADAAGVSAVVVASGRTDVYNPNAIRASLGTVFSLPVCAAPTAEVIAWVQKQKLAIYAARVDGAADYTAVDFTRPCAIVLGSEAMGLSDAWSGALVTAIRIPMLGKANSLNVSATAAVLFYEAQRQRIL
jgi:RNA methyltransferase, TrmH family